MHVKINILDDLLMKKSVTGVMENFKEIFSLIDIENKGYITEKDLRKTSGINGNIDDIIKLLNIKKPGEKLTLHQFCQRIHGIHYKENYDSSSQYGWRRFF